MFPKFLNIEQEKQERIINAAIKEFAQKGYENASTNEIVKEAGISKGLLFHYFKNKKKLFLFLFDYCMNLVIDEFYKKINLKEPDFFVRLRQVMQTKIELQKSFPSIFKFIEMAFMEDSSDVKPDVDKRIKNLTDINVEKIYEGIDYSRFRDDIDLEKAIKIITWTFDKFREEELFIAKRSPSHEVDYESIYRKANEYFAIFKKCFYQ